MKRDMETIRKILFRIEGLQPGEILESNNAGIPDISTEESIYHCLLLLDAGLICTDDDLHPMSMYPIPIYRLTSAGHDFIDAARNDTIWKKTASTLKEKGISLTIDMTMQYLKTQAGALLGM